MTGYCQRSESTKVPAVTECNQAKWNDDEQDSFLVDVPAEQKGGVATKSDRTNERFPRGLVQ